MGKPLRKMQAVLARRRREFDLIRKEEQGARKRPGSMNPRKSG